MKFTTSPVCFSEIVNPSNPRYYKIEEHPVEGGFAYRVSRMELPVGYASTTTGSERWITKDLVATQQEVKAIIEADVTVAFIHLYDKV